MSMSMDAYVYKHRRFRYVVDFDFLGKDSIRYMNTVPVDKAVYKNLKIFMKGREGNDNLFDRLDVSILKRRATCKDDYPYSISLQFT